MAFRAHQGGLCDVTALRVAVNRGGAGFASHPLVAPLFEHEDDWIEVPPLGSESVLIPDRVGLIGAALQNPILDQLIQPIRKPMAGNAKAGLPVVKAPDTHESVANDQRCPAITDH